MLGAIIMINYCLDVGVLLSPEDKYFECYKAYDNDKYGFHDENQIAYLAKEKDDAILYGKAYVENGVDGTYAVLTDQGECENGNDGDFDDGCVEGFEYKHKNIIYSVAKINGRIVENFLNEDRAVLGWRKITENKTNTKENKTMKNSRENRMEALKAANIETGKYFSVTLPEGLKPGSTINVTISEDGSPVIVSPEKKRNSEEESFLSQIYEDGYVRNTRLHRRWVMAQMFRMLNYKSYYTGKSGYDAYLNDHYGYQYQFEMMLEEIRVLAELQDRDIKAFNERSRFFIPDVVSATCNDYINKLEIYVNKLPVHKCKGVPYKKVFGRNIFVEDLNKYVYYPQKSNFADVKRVVINIRNHSMTFSYKDLYRVLRKFCANMYRLPNETPKCKEWKDAFKGEGSYYTLMNLIKFHGCRVPGVKGNMMSLNDSLIDVENAVDRYRYEYYRLFAYMKRVIEANNFDFNKRMKELYPKKSA